MLSFEEYGMIAESIDTSKQLNEVQIQFNKNRDVNDGNILILAGGVGSGKGFILKNVVGMEGKVFDVDALKTLAVRMPSVKSRVHQLLKKIKSEKGESYVESDDFDFRDPDVVSTVHGVVGDEKGFDKGVIKAFIKGAKDNKDRGEAKGIDVKLPNIIFDVTLKDMKKMREIAEYATSLGYEKKKIHLLWIVNDVEVAKKQNQERSRVVPSDILLGTHKGASKTIKDILNMGDSLLGLMDGDIFFAFNKAHVDNIYISGDKKKNVNLPKRKVKSGGYMKELNYVHVKEVGRRQRTQDELCDALKIKISEYTPIKWN